MNKIKHSKIGLVSGALLLSVLCGCVTYVDRPHQARYEAPRPVYVESGVRDDYVYYPGYQVYYSSNRRQYVYQDGNSWVTRPTPPRVSVDVLFASPSVKLDFHDAPAIHHERVVRQYPQHWAPQGHENRGEHQER
jgi:hypothetical protein